MKQRRRCVFKKKKKILVKWPFRVFLHSKCGTDFLCTALPVSKTFGRLKYYLLNVALFSSIISCFLSSFYNWALLCSPCVFFFFLFALPTVITGKVFRSPKLRGFLFLLCPFGVPAIFGNWCIISCLLGHSLKKRFYPNQQKKVAANKKHRTKWERTGSKLSY